MVSSERQSPVTNTLLDICWLSTSGFIKGNYKLMINIPKHPVLQITISWVYVQAIKEICKNINKSQDEHLTFSEPLSVIREHSG